MDFTLRQRLVQTAVRLLGNYSYHGDPFGGRFGDCKSNGNWFQVLDEVTFCVQLRQLDKRWDHDEINRIVLNIMYGQPAPTLEVA